MEKRIDSQQTLDAVRAKYGSVLEFCRQMGIDKSFFYMVTSGQRGRGGDKKRGPNPTRSREVLERLEAEGMLFCREVVNG